MSVIFAWLFLPQELFTRVGEQSAVTKQPISEEEKVMALQVTVLIGI